MKKAVKSALIGAGAAAAAAAVGRAVGVTVVNEALDRAEPAIVTRSRPVVAFARTEEYRQAAALARSLAARDTERVAITASDGTELVGHWYPCENPRRALIAFHGWRSSWYRDFGASCDFWRDKGCSVLYVEQRAHGESGGDTIGFGVLERQDCLDWARWLSGKLGPETPIYLVGISMGATTVMLASDLPLPENVRGIVADCGFTSPEAIWKHVVKANLHLPYAIFKRRADAVCRERLGCPAGAVSTVDSLAKTKIPVLFIHGKADTFVPVEMSYENYRACASPKRILIVNGAEHGQSFLRDREGYKKAVSDFWAEFD